MWARQTIESEIFHNKPAIWFKIFFYIINRVNHKDTKQFKRGGGFFKYAWIATATGATPHQIKHAVDYLKKSHTIATQKATHGMTIQVINYNKYQNRENYKSHTEKSFDATQKPHRSHTINNNDNNDKKLKKELKKNIYIVINYLNQITGQHFSLDDETTKRHLTARLKTHTVDDCKAVILNRAVKWIDDDKMKEYLRPATLFNATKFEQYLGQVSPEDTMEWRIKQERKEMQNG